MNAYSRSRHTYRPILWLGIALLLAATAFFLARLALKSPEATGEAALTPGSTANPADATTLTPAVHAGNAEQEFDATLLNREWAALIAAGAGAAGAGPDAARAFVYQLFAALDRLMPDDRLAVVLAFFDSNEDVRLGSSFTIGRGGYLKDWPTLRVALLDYLSQRDGTAARMLAENLLRSGRPSEAGEWTLALRELARGKTAEAWPPLVVDRLHQFIGDHAWQTQGHRSWLEGFDVVVAGRSPEFLPDLSAVTVNATSTSRAAQFAAFLAADRLVLASPAVTLQALNRDPALFAAQPNVRAGLFARADVRKSEQLQELETYFRRTDTTPEERSSFAALFPLYDLAVSENLLTPQPSRPMGDMLAHDRATLTVIDHWLAEPGLGNWRRAFEQVRSRLHEQLVSGSP